MIVSSYIVGCLSASHKDIVMRIDLDHVVLTATRSATPFSSTGTKQYNHHRPNHDPTTFGGHRPHSWPVKPVWDVVNARKAGLVPNTMATAAEADA